MANNILFIIPVAGFFGSADVPILAGAVTYKFTLAAGVLTSAKLNVEVIKLELGEKEMSSGLNRFFLTPCKNYALSYKNIENKAAKLAVSIKESAKEFIDNSINGGNDGGSNGWNHGDNFDAYSSKSLQLPYPILGENTETTLENEQTIGLNLNDSLSLAEATIAAGLIITGAELSGRMANVTSAKAMADQQFETPEASQSFSYLSISSSLLEKIELLNCESSEDLRVMAAPKMADSIEAEALGRAVALAIIIASRKNAEIIVEQNKKEKVGSGLNDSPKGGSQGGGRVYKKRLVKVKPLKIKGGLKKKRKKLVKDQSLMLFHFIIISF